ncbi:SxtJ family membrane protein [Acidobacteria bacterium AH-259-D05]|nr:SxtJ family membrane protein [Acidobacteria bacterium AH-259-D05]
MSMIEINRNPSRRELLVFGLVLGLFTAILGALTYFEWDSPALAWRIWLGGGVITSLHFAVPSLRRYFYLSWMYASFPIGWTLSHALLAVLYYGILTPTGLIMRLFGYDPMSRRLQSENHTYWELYRPEGSSKRYFRQF